MVGCFIPLLIVASYAQWKKVSRGRKVNLVMAFTTVFYGLTIIVVSNFCGRVVHRSLGLIELEHSTASLACVG